MIILNIYSNDVYDWFLDLLIVYFYLLYSLLPLSSYPSSYVAITTSLRLSTTLAEW